MSFPTVAATNSSTQTGGGTSHTISLPSGISAGDLLIIAMTGSATDGTPNSAITGWTLLKELIFSSAVGHFAVFYRIADGTEGATVTATTDLSEDNAAVSYRITGWHGTTPPEVSTGARSTGTDTTPDPDSLTPSWGAADTLWIAAAGSDSSGSGFSAYPTNYSGSNIEAHTNTAGGGAAAMATRNLNAASDDPGTFTAQPQRWAACTIAVRPAAGGGVGSLLWWDNYGKFANV